MCKADTFDLLEEGGMSRCYRKGPHGRAKSPSAKGSWGSFPGESGPWRVRKVHEFQERRVHGFRDTVCKGPARVREGQLLVCGVGMALGTSGRTVSGR